MRTVIALPFLLLAATAGNAWSCDCMTPGNLLESSGNIVEPSRSQHDSLWPVGGAGANPPRTRTDRKSALISDIRTKEDGPNGESVRDIYVAQLASLMKDAEDPQVIDFFLELIAKDRNEWVRLLTSGRR